ncbi:Src tyrosine kinase 1 [Aplysia californica]|uniref:Tyrosine-protein kinase n=1 Tax=Aplysia californica TaxID=6500 RepID=B6DVV3_APLCA|nr:Src tyrosine kinase 1 [Aplysia californica]ACI23622.1 Src tyrosine kinase 1 [Aplysia californica]
MGNLCVKGGGEKGSSTKYLPDPFQGAHGDSDGRVDLNASSGTSSPSTDGLRPLPRVPARNRVRALYNFEAINQDDLSFRKGDLMEIDETSPETDDWWLAVHLKTKNKGYIPSNYVAKDDATPQTQDWWFEFDRKESDKMLLLPGNPRGTFLVREATDKSTYVLSVRDNDKASGEPCVKHYRVRKMDDERGYFISAKKTFKTLFDVIEHYKDNSDGLCCQLGAACPRSRPTVQFRELEIKREVIELTNKLGAGCFGEVWKGKLRKVVEVAVKTLKPGTMSSEAFLNEAKIMHKLTHAKLVQLMAVVSVQEPFLIITELMVNGALLDYLRSEEGKKLKFDVLIDMNAQVAEGMTYLESVNFVHRDLRAANILVGEHCEVKVADFGLARVLQDDDVYEANENAKFPIKWTAPEAALERKFSIKSDVWSFGVLMYEIITFGKVPYPGMSGAEVLQMVERGRRMSKPTNGPIVVEDAYFEMMLKCWNKVPEQRPTFEHLHDFFDTYDIGTEKNYREMDDISR